MKLLKTWLVIGAIIFAMHLNNQRGQKHEEQLKEPNDSSYWYDEHGPHLKPFDAHTDDYLYET